MSGRLNDSKVNLFPVWNLTSHIYLKTGSIIPKVQNFMGLHHRLFAISKHKQYSNISRYTEDSIRA